MFEIMYTCSPSMKTIIGAVSFVLNLIRWAIPVVLIILGSIDMFKAMASNDDKKAGEAKSTFIRRLIYAVVAFLVPFLVTFAFDIAGQIIKDNSNLNNDDLRNGNFFECWYNNGNSNNQTATKTDDDNDNVQKCNCHLCMGNDCYDDYISVYDCREDNGTCS